MLQVKRNSLIINIVPVTLSTEKIQVGSLPFNSADDYTQLRKQHWQTHAFRYDSCAGKIMNVTLKPEISPLGQIEDVNTNDHLPLIAKAIQRSILIWLAGRVPILRADKKLVFWGRADSALLLTQAIRAIGLDPVPELEVILRYEIDCRIFLDSNDRAFLGLIINVGTSNVINLPVSDLITRGVSPIGKYVCRHGTPEYQYLQPRLDLVGKVTQVEGSKLLLTDTNSVGEIDASDAFLEPRLENLQEVIIAVYNTNAQYVLNDLEIRRQSIITANGKLDFIRTTLINLRRRNILISNGVKITLGELITETSPLFPTIISTNRPAFLLGPQGRNTSSLPDRGIKDFGPYLYTQHTKNSPTIAVICEASLRGRMEQFLNLLRDGLPEEVWSSYQHDNPYQGGLISKFRLLRVNYQYEDSVSANPEDYRRAIRRILERLDHTPDLAFVQIKENFKDLRGNENPYFVAKSEFMRAGVPTQSICIEKIESHPDQLAYILNNIALATYAKLEGIPWVIATRAPTAHELVIGLGSSEVVIGGRLQPRTRYVGLTTVFQGDGRYIVWGMTREVEYGEYVQALLDSLRTTINHVKQNGNWQTGDRVRLIFHVYKRLKNCEIESIKALVNELITSQFFVEFAFLDISWTHPYYLFDPEQEGRRYNIKGTWRIKGRGTPERGICILLDRFHGLLHLTGPNDIKTDEQGLPQPLLVELHTESTFSDLPYLLRQMYHFTYMSWQSFFPATTPITVKYSQMIARLLGNLNLVTGWDSTIVSVGSLRGSRWFL